MKDLRILLLLSGLILFNSIHAQISGTVKDEKNQVPLVGAHIILYDSNGITVIEHTITGDKGKFTINRVPEKGMILVCSYLGYRINEQELEEGMNSGLYIGLEPVYVPVGEVTVSAFRQEALLRDIAMPVSIVDKSDLEKSGGFTISDIMNHEPGLQIARDGIWATSINIRGLSEQRIVTLIDGNRVETATDLAAGMSMVDINEIERIEVIKGAASSIYGTGALGGVVNIITRDGNYNDGLYTKGSFSYTGQNVNDMFGVHADVSLGDSKWYLRVGGGRRTAGNTDTPEGELANSQFDDYNLSVKAGIKPFTNHELKLNYQLYQAEDVGIPGGSLFPVQATASYPTEKRNLFSAKYSIKYNSDFLRETSLKFFHQYIEREVYLSPNINTQIRPYGYHNTNGGQFETSIVPAKGHSIVAGIDIWRRNLTTKRFKDISQPVLDSAGNVESYNYIYRVEIPIPETDFTSTGIYLQDEFKYLDDRLKVSIGGRFDLINVENAEAVDPVYLYMNSVYIPNPPNQRVTFEAASVNNHSWSADLGLLYSLTGTTDLSLSLSRAFRSPSIEERFKYIDLGASVSIGNPGLQPENGIFADLGLKVWKERFQLSANIFLNRMKDLIVAQPGEMIYERLDVPGTFDTVQAYINANVDESMLYGYDISFSYNFYDGLVLFGNSAFVRGRDIRNNTDLPLIPPLNGRAGIRYRSIRGAGAEFDVRMAADQNRIAEGESPTGGYATLNFNIHSGPLDVKYARVKLFAGMENITNTAYINHLSTNRGIVKLEPGRNFYFRIKLEF